MLSKIKTKIITLITVVSIIVLYISAIILMKDTGNEQEVSQVVSEKKINIEEDITKEKLNGIAEKIKEENSKLIEPVEMKAENCEHEINSDSETIVISEYKGSEECIVVPKEIDGKKVDKIEKEAFKECLNLETIKVPVEIKDAVSEIKYFEINEENTDENYIEYSTTREYSNDYIIYMAQSEEEKEKNVMIPEKFDYPLEEIYSEDMEELYGIDTLSETGIESSYDLRDYIDIKVENQGPLSTCYAYPALNAVETNIALTRGEIVDFSEIHASILSSGTGGLFSDIEKYINENRLRTSI